MKKSYLLLAMLGMMYASFAQQKETAVTVIGSMTIKINLNQATSLATITMTGPSTKWISIGLSTTSMSLNKDCITYGTSLLDQYLGSGHVVAITDTTNNLTLVSNTVSGTTRTVVMTRPFSTGDAKDYIFTYAMTSLNIIWAVGPSTNVASQHATFGSKALTFSTLLGTEDFNSLDTISVYPNPSTGIFNISKNNETLISKIRIFDINAKLLKVFDTGFDNDVCTINLEDISSGLYFLEISNDTNQVVKKIVIK